MDKYYKFFGLIMSTFILSGCGAKSNESANLVDGISSTQHRIFVSSIDYDGNLGGLSGADSTCASLASSAGLVKTYKAVISDSTTNAKDRLSLLGAIVMVEASGNQVPVASTPSEFWDTDNQNLFSNVMLDEYGASRSAQTPWSGTAASGVGALDYCNNWSDNTTAYNGAYGSTDAKDSKWLEFSFEHCDRLNPIYCISIE